MQRVITRINTITRTAYRDDSTIMAWELMNEPRCQVDYSGKTINVHVRNCVFFQDKWLFEEFCYALIIIMSK